MVFGYKISLDRVVIAVLAKSGKKRILTGESVNLCYFNITKREK